MDKHILDKTLSRQIRSQRQRACCVTKRSIHNAKTTLNNKYIRFSLDIYKQIHER